MRPRLVETPGAAAMVDDIRLGIGAEEHGAKGSDKALTIQYVLFVSKPSH